MIKALLCDFDGTLADTLWFYSKAYKKVLESFGFEFNDLWIYENCFGRKEEDICEKLGIPDQVEKFRNIYFSAANSYAHQAKLFPGVIEILEKAKGKNINLALISFARRRYIIDMIEHLNIKDFFKLVICFEDVVNPKPAPDAVIKVCNHFGIDTQESYIIGDSKSDILMGKNAGAKTILFFPKENEKVYNIVELKKTNPDHVINNWRQIIEML